MHGTGGALPDFRPAEGDGKGGSPDRYRDAELSNALCPCGLPLVLCPIPWCRHIQYFAVWRARLGNRDWV